jgi:hypothetical protein
MNGKQIITAVAILIAIEVIALHPAQAAFPGANGLLLFVDTTYFDTQQNLVVMNPDGTGQRVVASKTGKKLTQLGRLTARESLLATERPVATGTSGSWMPMARMPSS